MARILITGITGQIGSYATELLLAAGHSVVGVAGPDAAKLPAGAEAVSGPLLAERAARVLDDAGDVDAVIHLAGQSSVARSWDDPVGTFAANADLTVALTFASAKRKGQRLVHASSAEIFGHTKTLVQNEETPIAPVSPYAVGKAAGHLAVRVAREGMGAPASNVIFFLGESPRRPERFVFRKITTTIAAITRGKADHLSLGNTSVVRDFCHARDLARAAILLALGAPPGDYVCASGEGHTILDVARAACELAHLDPERVLRRDPSLLRASDVQSLVGDATKLRSLGWKPSVAFRDLVKEVYDHDLARQAVVGT